MTNTLLGIIVVALLIGFAIMASYYLAPRFAHTQNTAMATAVTQAITQVLAAQTMQKTISHADIPAGTDLKTIRASGYLSDVPPNPTGVDRIRILDPDGSNRGEGRYAMMRLDPDTAIEVCRTMIRQIGMKDVVLDGDGLPEAGSGDEIPHTPTGCFKAGRDFANIAGLQVYAYARFN